MNATDLIKHYQHAMDRAALLEDLNRPRAARRWLRRAGGMAAVLAAMGIGT